MHNGLVENIVEVDGWRIVGELASWAVASHPVNLIFPTVKSVCG